MRYTWSRYGGYEVSTAGDKRFSAFNAILPDGRSIEMHYQCDIKGYDVGGTNWRLGKGKPPLDTEIDLWSHYLLLWVMWSRENLNLLDELKDRAAEYGNVISDTFATTEINQARALAVLLEFEVMIIPKDELKKPQEI